MDAKVAAATVTVEVAATAATAAMDVASDSLHSRLAACHLDTSRPRTPTTHTNRCTCNPGIGAASNRPYKSSRRNTNRCTNSGTAPAPTVAPQADQLPIDRFETALKWDSPRTPRDVLRRSTSPHRMSILHTTLGIRTPCTDGASSHPCTSHRRNTTRRTTQGTMQARSVVEATFVPRPQK